MTTVGWVSGGVLGTSHTLSHFTLSTVQGSRNYYYLHFTGGETWTQRGEITSLRSQGREVTELGFEPDHQIMLRANILAHSGQLPPLHLPLCVMMKVYHPLQFCYPIRKSDSLLLIRNQLIIELNEYMNTD